MCNRVEDIRHNLPDLAGITHIFFPVLDSKETHWSLLVISIPEQLVVHYSSLPQPHGNQDIVRGLATKIADWCRWTKVTFQDMDEAPQQSSTDGNCGVHVCITMRYLLIRRLLQANPRQRVSVQLSRKKLDGVKGRS